MPKVNNIKEKSNIEVNGSDKDQIIDSLIKKVEELTKLVNNKQDDVILPTKINDEFEEPDYNKQIRLVSLCVGTLNLSTEPYGKGKLISFSKYGETKNVMYSTLIDIVNNNRRFAEEGYFYILDKAAVYYLGLTDSYTNLLSKDIIDNIYDYSPVEIKDLLENATPEQKENIIRITLDKLYNNTPIDLNKCDIIGKYCNVDIMDKLNEMKKMGKLFDKK